MEHNKKKSKAKNDKLFRFRSFTEQISSIKINVAHQIRKTSDTPDDRETFFGTALQKWKELNCTAQFVDFHREVSGFASSLAQLVHHKEELIASLLKHLQADNSLAYEPLLDLVVQLARDLHCDFYPHFPALFPVLTSVCLCHDAQLIQSAFTALAHLFKFLWRYMLRDIQNVYSLYSELLLQSQKPHIRQFATESFGFLLRKVRELDKLLEMIFCSLADEPQLVEGVGQLLFEVCKGVPKQFHSCTEKVLSCSLEKLSSESLPCDLVFQSLCHTVQLMAEHTRKEFSSPLWTPLLAHLQRLVLEWQGCPESVPLSRNVAHTLHLVGVAVAWRKGSRLTETEKVIKMAETVLSPSNPLLSVPLLSVALRLVTSLLLVSTTVAECHTHFPRLLRLLCVRGEGQEEVAKVLECFRELAEKHPHFATDIFPECIRYCQMSCRAEQNHTHIVHFLSELCVNFDPRWTHHDSVTPAGNFNSPLASGVENFVLQLESEGESYLSQWRAKSGKSSRLQKSAVNMKRLQLENAVKSLLEGGLCCVGSGGLVEAREKEGRSDLSTTWAALVCVQYMRPVSQPVVQSACALYSALKHALHQTTPTSPQRDGEWEQLLMVWSQAVSALCTTQSSEQLAESLSWEHFVPLLRYRPTSPLLLSAAECYLRQLQDNPPPSSSSLTAPSLQDVLSLLQSNLSSPSSPVRLLSLKILSCCPSSPDVIARDDEGGGVSAGKELLEVCLKAEQMPARLAEYRDKLRWLERLKYHPQMFYSLPAVYHEIPLRYLIGSLYVNFSLLWEPVSNLIASYGVEENKTLFWKVFGSLLEESASSSDEGSSLLASHPETQCWHDSIPALSQYQYMLVCSMERGRPDHVNFRRLLWKCLSDMTSFAEPRSRILAPLLLQFIEREYILKEDNLMEFQDLRKTADSGSSSEKEEDREGGTRGGEAGGEGTEEEWEGDTGEQEMLEELSMDLEEGDGEREEGTKKDRVRKSAVRKKEPKKQPGSRGLTKVLMAMLNLFSKFQNPKALYRQEDLHNLYMKLLTHKDTDVQQLTIDCLLTYRPPYLVPYQENLERLLDNTSFREEILNFNTDSTCCVVSEEHRTNFLPILIRVLYGRIQRTSGAAVSRVGVASRRAAVLQFLAGCEGTEMAEFFGLLLLPFHSLRDSSSDSSSAVDIGRVIPIKKQHGFLSMLAQIISVLGPLVEPHLQTFLTLLLKLVHCHHSILDNRQMIQPGCVAIVRGLRQMVITRITECFKIFMSYDFSPFEDSLYDSVVWPQLFKLPNESIQHPTPLMKLIITWSKFPRYHHLLDRPVPKRLMECSSRGPNISSGGLEFPPEATAILYYVYQCLFAQGVSESVTNAVLELTLKLLDGERDTQSSRSLEFEEEEEEEGSAAGIELVSRFIPTLLTYLGGKVRALGERTGKEGGNLQLEFRVLSRISSHVRDPVECSVLVTLLLPFLSSSRYKKHQDRILVTLQNLLSAVEDISAFYRPLSRLFCEIVARENRNTLCIIFQVLAGKDPKWKKTADIVAMLNAWDSRHIDEPAYETRQDGYAAARELLKSNEGWTVKSVLPVVYNAIFTLQTNEEMSLRDAASSFISDLTSCIQMEEGEKFHYLVMSVVVTAVKQGLRMRLEFARHESVSILSSLVKSYPTHPKFSDMATHLTHAEKEADFFENVRHIQLHRRTRAMRRLAAACREGQLIPHSMTAFLVPLANQVIFHSTSNMEQNLVAESVNVVSGMCSRLKWTNYCYLLRHYLRLITKKPDIQKILIRVVVAILDAFHFDVSGASPLPVQEKAELVRKGQTSEDVSDTKEERTEGEGEKMEVEGEEEGEEEEKKGGRNICEEISLQQQQKIHDTIVQSILPCLEAVLTKGSSPTPTHKLSTKSHDEEAHMLRVPVAMAMTKLLLTLPRSTLSTHLPGLLLKVCETLKNRTCDVRDVARDTLVKMATALGAKFLPYIIKEMKDLLTRGYQLHVLAFSLHSILSGLHSILKTGDLDPCLNLISQILVEDLFGVPAEEREAGVSVARIPESKNPQSYNSYGLVAQFLSPGLLPQLLAPIKEILNSRATSKTCHVVEDVFRRVGYGILGNDGFTPQALLVFIHGLVSNSIPQLSSKPRPSPSSQSPAAGVSRRPVDSRLIAKEPGRAKPKPATQANIAAHVVTEFGLQVLRAAFKRSKFDSSSTEQLQMLDPFLPLLTDTLSSRHTKVLSHSLHCLLPILRLPLPSLGANIHRVVSGLFAVLRKYARSGEMTGTNRELIVAAFKAVTVVLRDVKQSQISEEELKLLLGYVEEDIHDYQRQMTAFPLLRAILGRKFVVQDMHKLMYKIAQLSVTSDSDTTRQQCRQAMMHYIMDYPLGKKLKQILDFYVCNLSYDDQNGRESVVESFSLMFAKFPDLLVHRYATFFFVPLSSQLANDDSPTCKRMIAETLTALFKRLNTAALNDVIAMVKAWMAQKKLPHSKLAVQVLGLLVDSQGQSFEAHLPTFLPLLSDCLLLQHEYPDDSEEGEGLVSMATERSALNMETESKVVAMVTETDSKREVMSNGLLRRSSAKESDKGDNEEELTHDSETENEGSTAVVNERTLDHFLFGVVQVLCRVCTACVVLRSPSHRCTINTILEQVESLLLHPHAWVRLSSCQLFGHLFAAYQPGDLVPGGAAEPAATEEREEEETHGGGGRKRKRKGKSVGGTAEDVAPEYLLKEPAQKIPDLCHTFCMQLSSPLLSQDLANQAVKNLVFLARALHRLAAAGHMTPEVNHVTSQNDHITSDQPGDSAPIGRRSVRDLYWLVGRMARLASYEAGRHPQESLKRTSVLQWIAAVSLDLGSTHLPSYLPSLLAAPYREISDPSKTAGEALHTLAHEVVEVMKGVCGREEFSRGYSLAHRRALSVRERRRKQAALEAVMNPEKTIRRRQKKHLLTRASKRRKILSHRPGSTAAAKRIRTGTK